MHFNKEISIGNYRITENSSAFIIGEAGVNHNGNMETAFRLIDAAHEAGVNAIKFQTFKTDRLILRGVKKAPYQTATTDKLQTQADMLRGLEISRENNVQLKARCDKLGILFLSTPFEEESLTELCQMHVPAIKIAATDLTNLQLLEKVGKKKKPVILSAGMCYLEEIRKALEFLYPINRDIILLQCTANYPIRNNEANLNVIDTLKKEFDILVGYSDHSEGVGASPFAVAKGARVIEKHFTLDKNLPGPDHKASVTPAELKELVRAVRQAEAYLGTGVKMPTFSEQFTRKSLQKCFVARRQIRAGEVFTDKNIVAKRTDGVGISAIYYEELLEKRAGRNYEIDEIIEG